MVQLAAETPGSHVSDAVTLVIECCESEAAELVAEAALGDPAPGDRGQRHQTLVRLGRGATDKV